MKRIILILIFGLFVVQGYAQEKYITDYEVQYTVNYSIDSTHLDQKTEETVYLYTGADHGVFMNFNKANADFIQADIERQLKSTPHSYNDQISRKTNFDKVFYKNLETNAVQTVYGLAGQNYGFKEPGMPLKWQLKDSTKQNMGYSLQKATTSFAGRDYVAWFTLNVPIHDGPYLFSGLPGLIVELYDTRNDYHFKLKSIQKLDEPRVWTITEAKRTNKADVKKLRKKEAEIKARDMFTPSGGETEINVIVDDKKVTQSEYQRILEKRMDKENNSIELK